MLAPSVLRFCGYLTERAWEFRPDTEYINIKRDNRFGGGLGEEKRLEAVWDYGPLTSFAFFSVFQSACAKMLNIGSHRIETPF